MKPYSGNAEHVAVEQDIALLEVIGEEHGAQPSLLTAATAEQAYESAEADFLDTVSDTTTLGVSSGRTSTKAPVSAP